MNDISKTQNLEAHYTTSTKIVKPKHVVVEGPDNIPKYKIYTDREANKKLAELDKEIYESVKSKKIIQENNSNSSWIV